MAMTGTRLFGVLTVLRTAVAQKVRGFNMQKLGNALWAMAKTGTHVLDAFEVRRGSLRASRSRYSERLPSGKVRLTRLGSRAESCAPAWKGSSRCFLPSL